MKKIVLIVTVTVGLFIMSAGNTVASIPAPEALLKPEASIPSVPSIPEEDDFLCGDVNEDGFVNVLDIIFMVNYIMGGNPSPFNQEAADIKADNGINVLDIIGIVNIIMQVKGLPCGCVAPVSYEGQTYSTVQIGDQCWFKENMNVGTMIIVNTGGHLQMDNDIIEKYCFDNNPVNCDIYGGLYEWDEAMQYLTDDGAQGICPSGWHLPKDDDWKILEGTVDSQYPVGDPEWDRTGMRGSDAGTNLKTTTGWQDQGNGTDLFGFSGLPAGHRYDNGFYEMGSWGQFWTSTPVQYYVSWHRYLTYYFDGVFRTEYVGGDNGFSVRCIKGCWPEPTQANAGPDQMNVPGTSTTLAGNTPASGTGVWGIVSGTGGTFVDPWSPTAEFQGIAGNEYSLTWTITTDCSSTADTVVISFAAGGPFVCGDILVDTRDGQSYPTVQIGYLCFMTKNMNVGTMVSSSQGGQIQADNDIIEKFCYGNDPANCDIYGGLYEWDEAMQYETSWAQGICPEDWHIPTDDDWKLLEGTVDSQYPVGDPEWDEMFFRGLDAGGNLKETGFVHWNGPNLGATNESGFTALPGGYRYNTDGLFYGINSIAYFWSSTQSGSDSALDRRLYWDNAMIARFNSSKRFGLSVRCMLNS